MGRPGGPKRTTTVSKKHMKTFAELSKPITKTPPPQTEGTSEEKVRRLRGYDR